MSINGVSEKRFAGRVGLVTGGSRGIGRACCVRLAREGAKVAINFRSGEAEARETLRLVEEAGAEGCIVHADVTREEEVARMVAEVEQQLDAIDLLVNNAGVFDYVPHGELTSAMWRQTIEVNLTGTFLVTWAVKEGMVARKFGRIVNVSSISALQPRPMSIAYAASKAGVVAFTKSIAAALAGENIRVNAVAPGLIETEILSGVSPEALEKIVAQTPMGRIGQPEEVAAMVSFLLSEESSFTTGQTMVTSGGRAMVP